jgi:hypothetical protein
LSSQNIKPGKVLPSATAEMVKKFYVSDQISKIMQGQRMMFFISQGRRFIFRNG